MKSIALGCLGAILGLGIGIALMLGAFGLNVRSEPGEPVPAANSSRADVSITASASFINTQLQQTIKQSGLAKQATVSLSAPNVVQVSAVIETTVLGQRVSVNATVRMRVSVQNGRIALTVEKVDMGNALIPQSLIAPTVENVRAQAENQINVLAQRALQGANLRVTNVRMTSGELTVDLTSQ